MLKANSKGIKNSLKTRGGIVFFNSVRKSLSVNEAVRRRALSDRSCAAPVRCQTVSNEATRGANKQDTVGKCAGNNTAKFGPKDLRKFGLAQDLVCEVPIAAPSKFFSLPNFDLQVEGDIKHEPQWYEDNHEFLFVDANKLV